MKQGWVGDLEIKTVNELKDLLLRQQKILKNRILLSKLKDGGTRVQRFYEEIKDALQKTQIIKGKLEKSILEDPSAYEEDSSSSLDVKESLEKDHSKNKENLDSDDEDTHQINSVPVKTKANTHLQDINRSNEPTDFGTKRIIWLEEKLKKNQGKFTTSIETHKPLATKSTFLPGKQKKHDPRLWDDSVSTDRACRPVKMISLEESYQLQKKRMERVQKEDEITCNAVPVNMKNVSFLYDLYIDQDSVYPNDWIQDICEICAYNTCELVNDTSDDDASSDDDGNEEGPVYPDEDEDLLLFEDEDDFLAKQLQINKYYDTDESYDSDDYDGDFDEDGQLIIAGPST